MTKTEYYQVTTGFQGFTYTFSDNFYKYELAKENFDSKPRLTDRVKCYYQLRRQPLKVPTEIFNKLMSWEWDDKDTADYLQEYAEENGLEVNFEILEEKYREEEK